MTNWYLWTMVLESPLDCKDINPVNSKGNQSWIFIGRTDAEAEAPILRPPDAKSQLIRKDPDSGKDWRQEKGKTEDKMVGWHHWFDGHEFEEAPGDGEGQGNLVYFNPWGHKESDTTEWLKNNDLPKRGNWGSESLALVWGHRASQWPCWASYQAWVTARTESLPCSSALGWRRGTVQHLLACWGRWGMGPAVSVCNCSSPANSWL